MKHDHSWRTALTRPAAVPTTIASPGWSAPAGPSDDLGTVYHYLQHGQPQQARSLLDNLYPEAWPACAHRSFDAQIVAIILDLYEDKPPVDARLQLARESASEADRADQLAECAIDALTCWMRYDQGRFTDCSAIAEASLRRLGSLSAIVLRNYLLMYLALAKLAADDRRAAAGALGAILYDTQRTTAGQRAVANVIFAELVFADGDHRLAQQLIDDNLPQVERVGWFDVLALGYGTAVALAVQEGNWLAEQYWVNRMRNTATLFNLPRLRLLSECYGAIGGVQPDQTDIA